MTLCVNESIFNKLKCISYYCIDTCTQYLILIGVSNFIYFKLIFFVLFRNTY